jgi:hypothetical protein
MDAGCYGRIDIHDWSENLDHTDKDLPTGQIDCGNIIFSGKCMIETMGAPELYESGQGQLVRKYNNDQSGYRKGVPLGAPGSGGRSGPPLQLV